MRKSQAAAAMLSHSSVGLLDSGMEVLKQRLEFLRSREEPVKQGPSDGVNVTLYPTPFFIYKCKFLND